METLEQVKNRLIDKIQAIKNIEIINSIDKLLETTIFEKDVYQVSELQSMVLEASEVDIAKDDLINDDDINQEEDLWLNK